MSGRGKGGKGIGRGNEDNTAQARRRKRQDKYAQQAEEDEYESEWHGVDQISERVICTRYAELPSDLLITSFAWLDSRDLLSLRAVCRSWSASSRSDRAWSSSHWQVVSQSGDYDPRGRYAFLSALAEPKHMPFLRSLTMPIDTYPTPAIKAQIYAGIKALTKLERIQFRHWVIPADLLSALPSLRHVEVQEIDCDGQGNDDFSAEEIAELCAVSNLKSFRGVVLPRAESIVEQLSKAPCAASLISLRLPSTCLHPFTRDLFAPLSSLEELEVELWSAGDYEPDGPVQDLSTLSALPSLRVMTFGYVDSAVLNSLVLSAPAWAARLESLTFGAAMDASPLSPAARCIRAIAECCTHLRVLHCAWNIETQEVTQQQWDEWRAAPTEAVAAGGDAMWHAQLSLMHLLSAPRAFRRNLLSLRFLADQPVSASAFAQLHRRFPSLLHASFTATRHSHRTNVWDNNAADYVESDLDEPQNEEEGHPEDHDEDGGEEESASAESDSWMRFEDEQGGSNARATAAASTSSVPAAPDAASALIQFSRAGGAAAAGAASTATAEEPEPSAAIPGAMRVFPAARLTTSMRRMLQCAPFHYLRALKQMARVPLSAGESDPDMRVAPRMPPIAVDMCV